MYLPGVGPKKKTLSKELGIESFGDLLEYDPYKYVDRSHVYAISEMSGDMPYVQIKGRIMSWEFFVGTHAVIEDTVVFKRLGLAVIDEQHRFGVAQRAKLWTKAPTAQNDTSPVAGSAIVECVPHILVMTATPIPRTLAMTLYGDLDVSVIDELPPGCS